jgi:MFS transporter, DHA2 family, methylenomycin A resistance protein
VLNATRQTGSVLGVALFGSLVAGSFMTGLHASLIISTIVLLTAAGSIYWGEKTSA